MIDTNEMRHWIAQAHARHSVLPYTDLIRLATYLETTLTRLLELENRESNYLTYGQGGAEYWEAQYVDQVRGMEERAEQAESALAAVEARERTLRIGCQSALLDWRHKLLVDQANSAATERGRDFNKGAAAAYQAVIGLLQKVVDGTVDDLDFDEAEYAGMLAGVPADGRATS